MSDVTFFFGGWAPIGRILVALDAGGAECVGRIDARGRAGLHL